MLDTDVIRDPNRLAKLRSLNLLDHTADPTFDRLTRFASKLLKTPIALLTLVEEERQVFKSHVGLSEPLASDLETPLSYSVCQFVVTSREPLIIEDARQHPLLENHPSVETFNLGAYVGIPIITRDGYALGTFCVMDHQPRQWTADEIEYLGEIAQSVMTEIELRGEIIENSKSTASLNAAEIVLTRERNLLRTVLDTIPIGVFTKDMVGRYQYVNSSFAEYVNLSSDQLIGTDVRTLYEGRGERYFREDMDILESRQSRISVEESHVDPRDPSQNNWYLTSKVPLLDEHGEVYGLLGVITDITARKKSEAALRASQLQLQAAISNAPLIFFMLDPHGVVTLLEGRSLQSVGIPPGAWVGLSLLDIVRDMPGGSESVQRALNREPLTTISDFGGHIFEVRYSPVVDDAGEFLGTIGVATDVTERNQAVSALQESIERLKTLRRIEAELNATLDSDQVLLFGLDVASRVSGAENGFIGLVDGEILRVAKPLGQYAGVNSFPISHGVIRRVIENKQAYWVQDISQNKDYQADIPNTVSIMMFPLIRHTRVIGVMDLETSHAGFFDSDTFEFLKLVGARLAVALENAQLYELSTQQLAELQELYGRVSYLERLKTDMIRIAAHDLRNPLTAIMGLTELMLEEPETLSTDHEEVMRDIDKAARQMYKMTGDILSIQRIEQSATEYRPIDIAGIVRHVYNNTLIHATRKHQTFDLLIPNGQLLVKGDEVQIREAIDNLINNAIKYTPDGGRVDVRLFTDDLYYVRFEVEDTGYGIPENQQARLFQPFYRAKTVETRKIEGTGLGLHLVKNIIERHSGQLTVKSEYGKGSTFGFTLKLFRDSSQPPSMK